MLKRRNSTDMVETAIRKLSSETNLNYFGPGSIARTIIESMAREIELLYDSIDINLSQTKLATASGAFLDVIGAQFGLTRKAGGSGTILAEDRSVRFYTVSGRLIDHLPGATPTGGTIPAGTTITNRSGSVSFRVSQNISFPSNASSVFVSVEPINPAAGSANNVPAGTLVVHSLGTNKVLCENTTGVIVGSDSETDDEFRLRVGRHINSRVTGGRTSVIQAAFSFPGVSDIRINEYRYGAGSFEILVVPTGSKISPNIIENINRSVKDIVPYGIKFTVRGPDVIKIAIAVQIDTGKGSLVGDRAAATLAAQNAIRNYIGNIPMGGDMIINKLSSIIIDSHPAIKDHRILQLNINCRPQVISNYRLRGDEVFDLDDKISNPILVV